MKKLLLSVICTATLSFNANAGLKGASQFKFVGDTQFAALCEAAATNDLALFKSTVASHAQWSRKNTGQMLDILVQENNFSCADKGLVAFSEDRGSVDITDYIIAGQDLESRVASTSKFSFVGDTQFAGFCRSAVTNSLSLFKRAVNSQIGSLGASRKEVLNKALAANNVTCAGVGLSEFFEQRDASNIMGYVADKNGQ
jgi:hypothetical protein